jgi:HD-GYP domain-containing protein (c-di-GMP phosphodiesterase class II)
VLRRFFSGPEEGLPDNLTASERLFQIDGARERSEHVLKHLSNLIEGDARGFVVTGSGLSDYAFEAVRGYGAGLLALNAHHGPWRDPGPRIIQSLVQEMFTPNEPGLRNALGDLGLRQAKSALVVPLSGPYHNHGAMVILKHAGSPFSEDELKLVTRWGGLLGVAHSQSFELRRTKLGLVQFTQAFVEAMEAQDFAQLGHGRRVSAYAMAIGRALELDQQALGDLFFAAVLHDVGKLGNGLDLAIEDMEHPQRGANLVASSDLLGKASLGIRHHHENWDGSGFPDGLRKEQIPLIARIVAVADTFDMLSSERGQALPIHEVEKGLDERGGGELDPEVVSIFINILRQGKSTQELARIDESDLPF